MALALRAQSNPMRIGEQKKTKQLRRVHSAVTAHCAILTMRVCRMELTCAPPRVIKLSAARYPQLFNMLISTLSRESSLRLHLGNLMPRN
jgi:hypothetical protein